MILNANIPLNSSPTRQKLWRVVSLWGMVGLGLTIGWWIASLAWQGFLHPPTTATWSLSLRNTPAVNDLLNTYTKGISPLPGLPWDIPTLLRKTSAQSISIFMHNNALAISLYRPRNLENLKKEAESFGFIVSSNDHFTIISPTLLDKPSSRLMLPSFFGIGTFQKENVTLAIRKKRNALSLSLPTETYQPSHLLLPTNDPLLALRIFPNEGITRSLSLHDQAGTLIAHALETQGGEVAIWEKEKELFYTLWLPIVFDANTINVLAHASAQKHAEATIHERVDGKVYTETRLTKPLTLTSTTTNDITSTIVTTANNIFVMRITQTPTTTTLTNAPLEAEETFTPSAHINLRAWSAYLSSSFTHPTNTILLLRAIDTLTLQKDHLTLMLR